MSRRQPTEIVVGGRGDRLPQIGLSISQEQRDVGQLAGGGHPFERVVQGLKGAHNPAEIHFAPQDWFPFSIETVRHGSVETLSN